MGKKRIVIICDNKIREFDYLFELGKTLKKSGFEVYVIGSVAEQQKMYFYLYKLKPNIVILSQVQEKCTRDLATYVKKSGGKVVILPAELTYSKSNLYWIFNNKLAYSKLIDMIFVPGRQMYKDYIRFTDIPKIKLSVVGSPKMDLYIKRKKYFMNRSQFSKKHKLPYKNKNIIFYSTFYCTDMDYVKDEIAFVGNVEKVNKMSRSMEKIKKKYLIDVTKICDEFCSCNIIIKPHPLESPKTWLKLQKSKTNLYIIENETFVNTLKSVDVALHWNSTVASELWINNIDTIQYHPFKKKYNYLLSDLSKGNVVIRDYSSLKAEIENKLQNRVAETKYAHYRKEYVDKWYYKVDGKSFSRISETILSTGKESENLNYKKKHKFLIVLVELCGIFFGQYLKNLLIGMINSSYQWKYAYSNNLYLKC